MGVGRRLGRPTTPTAVTPAFLIVQPKGAGNPAVAGTDVREQGTSLVVARDRGPLARIRAPRRGSPRCWPTARAPMPRSQASPRGVGARTRVVFTVERREMADVVATRTVGAALVAARIDPRQIVAHTAPRPR